MDLVTLKACPFCDNRRLKTVTADYSGITTAAVLCSERCAHGPIAHQSDPIGHAEFLRNQRKAGPASEH